MPKLTLLISALLVVVSTAVATLIFFNSGPKAISKSEIDTAVNQAKLLYREKKGRGENFTDGPCLSNALMPNWVADLAHNPRLPADDLPQNQCPAFLEGRVKHFVELDIDGSLLRAK